MKKIRKEVIESAQKYWRRATLTPILTFLSSKVAGVNPDTEVHVGKEHDEKFLGEFLLENGKRKYRGQSYTFDKIPMTLEHRNKM